MTPCGFIYISPGAGAEKNGYLAPAGGQNII